jgi:DNA polymerase-3 subunit gamma/tau
METLYRKYRSQTFGELVGQSQVTQILRNAIRRGRLSHAYLFCGPRGTGKTSVARIFAKALCCLNPVDGDCCGICTNCVQIATGNALDVQEIDAASKNKVDDIRELRDRVGYAPAQFPYKIYIIDEVHMVTTQGFNALLKTLEEPPAHVKFLLCTTEAHKLPVTILSRCIRLDFTRIALPELAHHLQWIAGQEGFVLEADAALDLAGLAEGSARDAISLLDQLTVYCEGSITRRDVRELFQLGDLELVPSVVEAIRTGARRELLDTWERLTGQGADAGRFLLQVADALKKCYLESGDVAWRHALEAIWQGLNLLKQESFPALLVELSLLQATEAYAAPELRAAAAPAPEAIPNRGMPADFRRGAGGPASAAPAGAVPSAATPVLDDDVLPPPVNRTEFQVRRTPPARPAAPESASPVPGADLPPRREAAMMVPTAQRSPEPLPPASPDWTRFLAELQGRSLTAYALVAGYTQGSPVGDALELPYAGSRNWARQACTYAQFPEMLAALSQAALPVYGTARVAVGMTGEEGTWKRFGYPGPDGGTDNGDPPGNPQPDSGPGKVAALFERKTAGLPPDDPLAALEAETAVELPDPEEFGLPLHPGVDPQALDDSAERLGSQLDRAATAPPDGRPTVEEVIELFGGTILPEE